MLTRGYLWQALRDEIEDEFAALTDLAPPRYFAEEGITLHNSFGGWDLYWRMLNLEEERQLGPELLDKLRRRRRVIVSQKRRAEAAMMPPAERMRATRARRRSEGRCVSCERKVKAPHVRCDVHLKRQREIDQAYRDRHK